MQINLPAISVLLLTCRILVAQDLSWPDPIANHVIPMQSTNVTHGPILGNVSSNGVRVWIRSNEEISFEVLVQSDRPPFDDAIVFHTDTKAENDFTGYAEINGLQTQCGPLLCPAS